jgi:predicted phage gp36 major capsid-like protein
MDDLQLATVTATTRPLVVGDWQQYVIADRIGMVSEPIQTLFDQATGRPTGQRGLFCWYGVGADTTSGPAATGPFRMLKVVTAA